MIIFKTILCLTVAASAAMAASGATPPTSPTSSRKNMPLTVNASKAREGAESRGVKIPYFFLLRISCNDIMCIYLGGI